MFASLIEIYTSLKASSCSKRNLCSQVWEFVLRNQPVVIEDAVNADDFPPFFDFTEFDYLRERCGHRYVKVKGDSCWDNKGRQLFLNDPTIEAWPLKGSML